MNRDVIRRPHVRVWRWPIVIAILIVFGLLAALLGHDGIWRVLSWTALAMPLVVIGYFAATAR